LFPSRDQFQNVSARLPGWCVLAGLFLLICGSRLWLIHCFGNATPFWDEWDSEVRIIRASVDGTLSPTLFFEAHNEHRSAFTQLLILLLFRANKQWDPILQMVAQAPIAALAFVSFVGWAGTCMSNLGRIALAGFAAFAGSLPFGWENTLWGDQSCFYFMQLFGIAVIWLCWRYEALTARWWLGALVAFASLFTMAGGVFSIVAITGFLAARLALRRAEDWRRPLTGIIILAAIAAFGVAITPRPADNVAATSIKAFLWALSGILSWPCSAHWACVIIEAPLILLAVVALARRIPFSDGAWFVIIAGAASWIQAIVTAIRRCELWPSSRYCDSWSMLLVVLCSCLYFLRRSVGERRRYLIQPLAAVWFLACLYGVQDRAIHQLPAQLMNKYSSMMEMENNVRNYLATGNSTCLQGKIPYPFPNTLQDILSSDSIRRVLPPNLMDPSPPLSPASQNSNGGGFVQNGYSPAVLRLNKPVFGTYGKPQTETRNSITLRFTVPRGTREANLQVAGYPSAKGLDLKVEEAHGASHSIAPFINPGDNWQTITVGLNPKSTFFKISAKDQSEKDWLAFSMPTISNNHVTGIWARFLAGNFFYFVDFGLVLLLLGGLGSLAISQASSLPAIRPAATRPDPTPPPASG
jgi:hypothetical protein